MSLKKKKEIAIGTYHPQQEQPLRSLYND